MQLQVLFLCLSCLTLASQSQAKDQASLRRANDQAGRCQYTFTVASPEESSCPGSSVKPEMDRVLSRLTLLEALVSRLIAGTDGSADTGVGADGELGLQEAYSQVTGERNQLQQDKERLNRQVQELQRRLDELSQEAESLRQRPCQQAHTSGGAQYENRPASGMYNSESIENTLKSQPGWHIFHGHLKCVVAFSKFSGEKLIRRQKHFTANPASLLDPFCSFVYLFIYL